MSKRVKSNSIRLIAGRWRGTRLPVLDHSGLRPTTDRVRETLFNWLMHDIPSARVLDVFAGTGALGLECLSRGAKFVQFIEADKKVAGALNENIERLFIDAEQATVNVSDALRYLSNHPVRQFDLVFLDPPFDASLLTPSIAHIEHGDWLAPEAVVYIEYDSQQAPPDIPITWQQLKSGKTGQSAYALYRRSA